MATAFKQPSSSRRVILKYCDLCTSQALNNLALVCIIEEQWDEALELLDQAIAHEPTLLCAVSNRQRLLRHVAERECTPK
jgi:uncharacterized protein (DUF1778 family)